MRELLLSFAEHLGLSPDEAAPALQEVMADLASELATAGHATLEGVGTFAAGETGAHFEPDEILLTTVNGDYAGLGPLAEPAPIAVPFLTAFPVVPVAAEEVFPAPDLPGQPPSENEVFRADHPAGRLGDDALDEDLAAAMAGEWTAPPSPPVASLEPTNVRTVGGYDVASEDAEFTFVSSPAPRAAPALDRALSPFPTIASPAPFAATATTQPAAPLVAVAREEERERRSALWWAVPVVALVAVGAWLFARGDGVQTSSDRPPADAIAESGGAGRASAASGGGAVGEIADRTPAHGDGNGPPERAAAATQPARPSSEPRAAGETAPAAPAPAPRQVARDESATPSEPRRAEPTRRTADRPASTTPAQPRTATPEPVRQPTHEPARPPEPERAAAQVHPESPSPTGTLYGLTGGGVVDAAAGGATWILNSTSASEATGQADRYRTLGFRSAVLSAVVDGRRVHRVAVGQFPGVAEARAARSLLPPDAPADAWILRLGNAP